MTQYKQSGFTLLEVLIAITITAIIGVGASQLLSGVSETQASLESRATELKNLQRLDIFLRKDLSQLAGRKSKDIYGDLSEEIISTGDYLLELSYSGVAINLFDSEKKQSNILRTAYAIRSHDNEFCKDAIKPLLDEEPGRCFVRLHWSVLDKASDTEPVIQVLLDNIEDVSVSFRGQLIDISDPSNSIRSNEWLDEWPSPFKSDGMISDLVQVKVTFTTQTFGEIERLFEVPRYAFISQ